MSVGFEYGHSLELAAMGAQEEMGSALTKETDPGIFALVRKN